MKRFTTFFSHERVILSVYVLISIITAIQHLVGGPRKYNNFIIFRRSFDHLLAQSNLHIEYPSEYYDLFLYHPSFAILFSPFSLLPVPVSLILWLIVCSVVMFYSIRSLPINQEQKVFFWWFILIELVTSLHSQQTNPLIGALGLLTFSFLEKGKTKWAALFPILAFCIKGYGIIFAALFMFYPKRTSFVRYSVFWLVVLAVLPFPFVGPQHFVQLYEDWYACLIQDHGVNYGISIMGLVKTWVPSFQHQNVALIQYIGVFLFALTWLWTLFSRRFQSVNERLLTLSYASLWVIIFNHASESPTFVIAIQGVALWYIVIGSSHYPWGKLLALFVFMFSILATTDLYPLSWREGFFHPHMIKVIPCIVVWLVLQIQMFLPEDSYTVATPSHD